MENSTYAGMPGYGTTQTQNFTEVLASTALQAKMPGGVLLASGFGVVNKGRVLGKITASSKFAPYTSTTLSANAAAAATSITVADASAFIVGDNIIIGTEAAHAITAISGNTITIGTGLAAAQSSGASVTTNDGRSTAVCVLDNDTDTSNGDMGASAWVAGLFVKANCYGVDSNAQTALKMCMFF